MVIVPIKEKDTSKDPTPTKGDPWLMNVPCLVYFPEFFWDSHGGFIYRTVNEFVSFCDLGTPGGRLDDLVEKSFGEDVSPVYHLK